MCGSINRARHTPSRRHNPRPAISGTGGLRLTCVAVEAVLIAWYDAEVDEDDRVERAARSELQANGLSER